MKSIHCGMYQFYLQYVRYCRVMQVLYDKSLTANDGNILRTSTVWMMGVWHPYKEANLKIWQTFGQHFLAPLFHALFPGGRFYKNAKLAQVLNVLTIVRLSWSSWRPDLEALLKDKRLVSHPIHKHAQNLKDLCDYFIPQVCHLWVHF